MNEQGQPYGDYHRFYIEPFTGRDGSRVFMVLDANWITCDEIRDGHRSPVVAQFDTAEEAREWCRFVEEGKITSVPHEANFEGWPALRERVRYGVK